MKARLFKCIENFTTKNGKLSNTKIQNSHIFHISAQNIDCRYSLEPPRPGIYYEYPKCMFLSRNKKNKVYPCKPQFNCINFVVVFLLFFFFIIFFFFFFFRIPLEVFNS